MWLSYTLRLQGLPIGIALMRRRSLFAALGRGSMRRRRASLRLSVCATVLISTAYATLKTAWLDAMVAEYALVSWYNDVID